MLGKLQGVQGNTDGRAVRNRLLFDPLPDRTSSEVETLVSKTHTERMSYAETEPRPRTQP